MHCNGRAKIMDTPQALPLQSHLLATLLLTYFGLIGMELHSLRIF
jgi:hypothetical protein